MTKTDEIDDSSAPLMEHLVELRTRIMWCLLAFTVAMVLCFLVWNPIFDFLTRPLCKSLAAGGQGSFQPTLGLAAVLNPLRLSTAPTGTRPTSVGSTKASSGHASSNQRNAMAPV